LVAQAVNATSATFATTSGFAQSFNTSTLVAQAVNATSATNAATAYSTVAVHTAGTGLTGSTFNGSTAVTWTVNTTTLMAQAVSATSLVSGTWTFTVSSTGSVTLNGAAFVSGSGTTAASGTGTTTTFVISNATPSTGTNSGALQVVGGVGIGGALYVGGTVTGGGVRTTTTSTAPANPTVGDIWYYTASDVIYRYTNDGSSNVWLDITGPTYSVNTSGSVVLGVASVGTTATTSAALGYLGMPQNSTAASYTLVASDQGKHIYVTASAQTITIPANATVPFPIGTTVALIAGPSATTVTISITTDTMYLGGTGSTGNRTLAAYGMATAVKVAATTWFISGLGLT
jgi:hypothetical protein